MARQKLDKTNAIRLLEAKRVPYEALTYDAEVHSAVSVASALGVPPEQVYKTLVVLREEARSRPLLVMIPSSVVDQLTPYGKRTAISDLGFVSIGPPA